MIVRRESPGDAETLRKLFSEVYSDTMFDALHNGQSWIPAMSFVALGESQEVTGHVAATRGQVGTADVLPWWRHPSIQHTAAEEWAASHAFSVLGAAEARGEPLVGLVAMPPEYHSRFGLEPAEGYGITPPVGGWQPYFPSPHPHRLHPRHHRHLQLPRSLPVKAKESTM